MLSWWSWTSLLAQLQQHAWAADMPEKQNKSASAKFFLPSLDGCSEPAFSVTVRGRYPLRDCWEEELIPKAPEGSRSLIALGFCCLSAGPVLEQGEEQAGLFHVLAIVSSLWAWPLPLASLISCVFYSLTWSTAGAGGL